MSFCYMDLHSNQTAYTIPAHRTTIYISTYLDIIYYYYKIDSFPAIKLNVTSKVFKRHKGMVVKQIEDIIYILCPIR